jgi:uracil-DNA glycosylase
MTVDLEPSWLELLKEEFDKPYLTELKKFLVQEKQDGHTIYPKGADIFNAFEQTPVNKVKIVILGQDPYHGVGQAHGLSFSVQKGIALPPSLKNIFKELADEYPDFRVPQSGDLTPWTEQGVLLLNATLTVRAHSAGSHQKKGWEIFTDTVISKLSDNTSGVVFILWGNYAKQKEQLIDTSKHFIIKSAHPSPFSAYNGFFGSKPFSSANKLLIQQGKQPVNWQL